jgi:hypothetical protein
MGWHGINITLEKYRFRILIFKLKVKTVGEIRPKIEPKIRELTEPIFKAEASVLEKMKNSAMSVIDPILQEHVCPHLSKIVHILKSPVSNTSVENSNYTEQQKYNYKCVPPAATKVV